MTRIVTSLLLLWLQDASKMTPEARAKMEAQNTGLRAILLKTAKLPMEASAVNYSGIDPDLLVGKVSWVAIGRNGSIYLLQRGDKANPIIVLDRSGKMTRSWGKGMYTMPHSIRIDPAGNVWTTDAASSMVYKFSPEGKKLLQIEVGGQPSPCDGFCSVTDIAFAPNGNLYISDGYRNARILEYTPEGQKSA